MTGLVERVVQLRDLLATRADADNRLAHRPEADASATPQRNAASGSGTNRTASGPAALTLRWYSVGV